MRVYNRQFRVFFSIILLLCEMAGIFYLRADAAHANSRNYYVDSVDGSDSNSGTAPDSPWQTLDMVHAHRFLPGDVIHFRRGSIWDGGLIISASGVRGNPIVFTAYGEGNKPIFRNPAGYPTAHGVEIQADWIILEEVLVRDALQAGVYIAPGADHNIVRNVEATQVGFGVEIHGQHNLVTQSYFHDLTIIHNTPGGNDDYGAVGVDLQASYNEVSLNSLVNCRAASYDYGTDGGAVEIWRDVDYTSIHHNWAVNNKGFIEIGGLGETVSNTLIAYNISINNERFSLVNSSGDYAIAIENLWIENNTIIHLSNTPSVRIIDSGVDPPPEDVTRATILRNNIIYVSDSVRQVGDEGLIHDHNLFYFEGGDARLGFSLAEGEVVADPLFVSLWNGDFHLMRGSPAIDAGVDLGLARDFDNNPVPLGAAPDIGAFEYQETAPGELMAGAGSWMYPPRPLPLFASVAVNAQSSTGTRIRIRSGAGLDHDIIGYADRNEVSVLRILTASQAEAVLGIPISDLSVASRDNVHIFDYGDARIIEVIQANGAVAYLVYDDDKNLFIELRGAEKDTAGFIWVEVALPNGGSGKMRADVTGGFSVSFGKID